MPRNDFSSLVFIGTSGQVAGGATPWYYSKQTLVVGEMLKNVASQIVGIQMVTAADGSAFTGSVTCYVTGDGGTQAAGSVGSGACTSEGNGYHTYAPAQAETNYNQIAFTFTGSGAIPATLIVYTDASYDRIGAPVAASISADIADVEGKVDDLEGRLTATRAGYLDNLSAGAVALEATAQSILTDTAEIGAAGAGLTALASASSLATVAGYLDTEVAAILADTNELQTDWVNGGRLDLLIDGIKAKTDNLPASPAAVGSAMTLESNAITAAVIATDAIDADAIATTAAAEIADAVWDEASADHVSAGSFGDLVQDIDDEVDYIHGVIDSIAITGSALSKEAASNTLTVGTESSGTYASTAIDNGVYHVLTAASNEIDVYYEFNIGTSGVPTKVNIAGYLREGAPAAGDTIDLYAYQWGTGWELLQTAIFTGITTAGPDVNHTIGLLNRHVGTGADDGKVRIRFQAASLEAGTTLNLDYLVVEYAESIAADVASILADTGTDGVVVAAASKTGYALTSAYDAAKTASTQTSVDAIAGYLDTEVAAILADTNELQTDWVNGGRLDLLIDGIKAKTDNLPASPAAVGSAMTLESGAITAAVVATGAIDADALATDAVTEIADGMLNRDLSTGTDSGSSTVRTVRQALRFLRNKWAVSTGTLTVYKEDDATESWTATVTTDAAANPITGNDPAGP